MKFLPQRRFGRQAVAGRVLVAVVAPLLALLVACDQPRTHAPGKPGRVVVVYCSADAPAAQPVFEAFEKGTGIKVEAVFDTEATKTTGLVNRLLAEHDRGQTVADVWWSSEPYGTIRLSRAGVLEKYESPIAATAWDGTNGVVPGRWNGARGSGGDWYGLVRRLRVLAYNTKHAQLGPDRYIKDWMSLADPIWKGRVGMARPQFGTTRGHMAAMHAIDNGKYLRTWLEAMVANDIRLYDGNAAVARAVASGELYIGLTDSDDAINGIRQGWPIAARVVGEDGGGAFGTINHLVPYFEVGSLEIPNTIGIVKGGKHPEEARALVDYLLSKPAGILLSEGDQRALLFGDTLVPELAGTGLNGGKMGIERSAVDFESVADHIEPAMVICDEVLRGR